MEWDNWRTSTPVWVEITAVKVNRERNLDSGGGSGPVKGKRTIEVVNNREADPLLRFMEKFG